VQKPLKTASDSHFRQNRKQKYGGNGKNELAAMDFLFDFLYIMGSNTTLCGRSQGRAFYTAHYKRRRT